VLVVQANAFNDSRINTVVVAVITSNLRLAEAPGNVRLPRRSSGLGKASVVNVSQLMTLDRRFLSERLKALPSAAVERVDQGMRLALGL
jgi:mRNA interferase MazF